MNYRQWQGLNGKVKWPERCGLSLFLSELLDSLLLGEINLFHWLGSPLNMRSSVAVLSGVG